MNARGARCRLFLTATATLGAVFLARDLLTGPLETHRRLRLERAEAQAVHLRLGGLRTLTTLDLPGRIATRSDVEALLPGWRPSETINGSSLPGGEVGSVIYRRPEGSERLPGGLDVLTPGPPLRILVTYDAAGQMRAPAELVD